MALTGTKGLMIWCQRCTEGYKDVHVKDMTKSFRDGLAFCAIIHHFRPDLINFDSLSKENVWENNQLAFEVAEKELNIPSLLDPDDMVAMPVPDKLSIMTYVSQYYNCFKNKKGAAELGIKPAVGTGRTTVKRPMEEDNPFKGKEGITPIKKAFPANTCQVCGKKVYLVEKVVSNNKLYHRSCFKCNKCGGTLRPGNAKVGVDPSQIECQHHQDKIWNLRTNMASRIKKENKENSGTIWENQAEKKVEDSSPWVTQKPTQPAVPTAVTPPSAKKPPIPKNPPSKLIHPHLSSQSSARAQFFSPSSASKVPVGEESKKTKDLEKEKAKAGLITSIAGAMAKDEEKQKVQSKDGKLYNSNSKETLIDEPAESSTSREAVTPSPKVADVKPSESKTNNYNSVTSVSQRISMFSQNDTNVNIKGKGPVKEERKKDDKVSEKKKDDKLSTAEKIPEETKADTKPIVSGGGGVKAMINKMEEENDQISRPGFKPPPQPLSRVTSKRRAPAPPPQKRDVRQHHVTPEEIQKEIAEIEAKTSELEKKGIELEDKLRAEMKDDSPEDSEELLMEWFEVVNNKNQLVRREGELVAQAQIQDLEIQHAEVEYEMRVLMHKQEHLKTDEDAKKEEELLELLIALVQQRSTIVDRLEEDRIREQAEDETIRNMMQMKDKLLKSPDKLNKFLHPDSGLDRESVELKKEKKKKKKKKKHKEKDKEKTKEKEKHKTKNKDQGDEDKEQ